MVFQAELFPCIPPASWLRSSNRVGQTMCEAAQKGPQRNMAIYSSLAEHQAFLVKQKVKSWTGLKLPEL